MPTKATKTTEESEAQPEEPSLLVPTEPEPPVNAVHPYQLPANTAAAQAMVDNSQVAVLPLSVPYPEELIAPAQEAIVDYGDPANDPRMEGYTPPPNPPDGGNLVITSISPDTAPANTVTTVTINGLRLDLTHGNPTIGKSCHNTQINSPIELKTDTPGNQAAGTFPVTITLADGTTEITGPDFTYT